MKKTSLPDNTTDRLLAVADIIEFTPERWDQGEWFHDDDGSHDNPSRVIGVGFRDCGTAACIAGWAVALTPAPELERRVIFDWDGAGEAALGLHESIGARLFDGSLGNRLDHDEVADILRRLAKLAEGERDAVHAREVLTSHQLDMLGLDVEFTLTVAPA